MSAAVGCTGDKCRGKTARYIGVDIVALLRGVSGVVDYLDPIWCLLVVGKCLLLS